ncbi:hypothetical protein BJ684DRAFT_21090 [Piptocephalis cylindrospora]|uniref:Uncharacterized protein n=1 Tax=Piptocephalis cylindrospora TaxID=1907219 RepID=A0A4P9Y1I1_9FUNG|nr:hypothetical protein BJ684DRAFT_21090 [Piptocephalis cylindrospora]|eukprot:RKP12362.1 hypothetical protein BJ684DRAFT_21090 [Piptocephalis cylindrospora]
MDIIMIIILEDIARPPPPPPVASPPTSGQNSPNPSITPSIIDCIKALKNLQGHSDELDLLIANVYLQHAHMIYTTTLAQGKEKAGEWVSLALSLAMSSSHNHSQELSESWFCLLSQWLPLIDEFGDESSLVSLTKGVIRTLVDHLTHNQEDPSSPTADRHPVLLHWATFFELTRLQHSFSSALLSLLASTSQEAEVSARAQDILSQLASSTTSRSREILTEFRDLLCAQLPESPQHPISRSRALAVLRFLNFLPSDYLLPADREPLLLCALWLGQGAYPLES